MTALRQRFIEDLQLHGFAPSTQQVYVTAVKLLAGHYHQPPDRLSEEQIRQYFLHLTHVRKVSRSNATITLRSNAFQVRYEALTFARHKKFTKNHNWRTAVYSRHFTLKIPQPFSPSVR